MSVQIDGSTGNIIAIKADYSGDVSIGGTLTYEDVTNIDSVGLITARSGINVTGGNVGIGLTNPTTKLQVTNGHVNISAGYSYQWGDSHERIEQSDGKIEFFTGNTEKMTLSGSNLGLGAAAPKEVIDARGAAVFSGDHATSQNAYGTAHGIMLSSTSNLASIKAVSNGSNDVAIRFIPLSSGSGSEAMRIDSSGRLLLGTTTEGHVSADNFTVADSGHCGITIRSGTTSEGAIYFSDGTSGDAEYRGQVFYDHDGDYMRFSTAVSERLRIDSSGRLMLGTTTEGSGNADNLTVADSGHSGITIRSGTSSHGSIYFSDATSGGGEYDGYIEYEHANQRFNFGTAGNTRLHIDSSGNVGINYSSATAKLEVKETTSSATTVVFRVKSNWQNTDQTQFLVLSNGNAQNRNNSYTAISDAKLKENIVDANSQWEDLKNLRVRNYNFIASEGDPNSTHIGLVAQEVEPISPGLVFETPDEDENGNDLGTVTKSVNYSVLYMKAVKALQEAQTRIETLETQNTAQQTQIDDLLARVNALEG